MEQSWTVPISTGQEGLKLHGSANSASESAPSTSVVNVDGEKLKASLNSVMSKLDLLLAEAAQQVKNFEVAEVKVSLTLDSSGTVSILGVVKASMGTKGAIEVKFSPRK
jgi:hypothetical protein